MTPEPMNQQRRGRLQFLLLAVLFFAPLLAAYALYYLFPEQQPGATTNYGELLSPARPLPDVALFDAKGTPLPRSELLGRWSLVQFSDGGRCERDCEQRLITSRQMRTRLNEKRQRLQRILVAPDAAEAETLAGQLSGQHPDLMIVADPQHALADFVDRQDALALYLFDPLGNWLMRYPSGRSVEDDFKGLQKDIKKLLRLSQIG